MLLPEDDRVMRGTGAFRDNKNLTVLAMVLAGLVLIALFLMFAPR